MQEKMATSCGMRLTVKPVDGGYALDESCKDGHQPGTPVATLIHTLCPSCDHRLDKVSFEEKLRARGIEPKYPDKQEAPVVAPPPPATAACSPIMFVEDAMDSYMTEQLQTPVQPPSATAAEALPIPVLPPPELPVADAPVLLPVLPPVLPPAPALPVLPPEQPVLGAMQVDMIPLSSIVLPGGVSLGAIMDPEAAVDIHAVIAEKMPDLPGGPSSGGLSSHVLGDATCWRKFYLSHIMGLVPQEEHYSLRYGSLLHYCAAARYLFGAERQFEPCTHVARAGAAELAMKVKTLFSGMVDKYGTEEWETWCPRAVEYNMVAQVPCPVGQRTKKVPISSRVDLIIALKRPSDPHPAGGALPQGVYLVDHKTCSNMTRDLIEGYGMDWQFNVQATVFEEGGYASELGPLQGTIVNLLSKGRKTPTPDSYARPRAPLSRRGLAAFKTQQLAPLAGEVYRRIASSDDYRDDETNWPKDYRQCNGRWGRCEYFSVCESCESPRSDVVNVAFKRSSERVASVSKFLLEEEEAPKQRAAKKAAKEKKLDPASDEMTGVWAKMLLGQLDSTPQVYAPLLKDNFIIPGHTRDSVLRGLTEALRAVYLPFSEKKVKQQYNGALWSFAKSGISWKTDDSKGRVTWKGLATWITDNIWFDLSQALPE